MGDPRPQDPFQGRVDLGEHPAQPVGGGGDLGGQVIQDRAQPGLVVGQCLVVDRLPGRGHGVVVGLADVEAEERRWLWLL